MAGYIGTKAVLLSTTAATVTGDMTVGGAATISGATTVTGPFTSLGIDDNAAATAMTLDASGNVGIGTSSPTQALVVSESSTPTIQIKDGAASGTRVSGRLHIGEGDTFGVSIENSTSAFNDNCAMVFKTSPPAGTITERMRLDSSGNLLVGGTSLHALELMSLTFDGNFKNGIGIKTIGPAGSAFHVFFNSSGTQIGNIAQTSASTVAYNTSSDYRLKENITPIQGAADIVKAMRPCTYTFTTDGVWSDGFIAHELQELHPLAVTGSKDAMKDEEYEVTPAVLDEDGNVVTEAVMGTRSVPDYQGVDYSKLTPILTAALQEALNKIDALEARLTALEAV